MYFESVFIKPNNFYINIYNINLSKKFFFQLLKWELNFLNFLRQIFQATKNALSGFSLPATVFLNTFFPGDLFSWGFFPGGFFPGDLFSGEFFPENFLSRNSRFFSRGPFFGDLFSGDVFPRTRLYRYNMYICIIYVPDPLMSPSPMNGNKNSQAMPL